MFPHPPCSEFTIRNKYRFAHYLITKAISATSVEMANLFSLLGPDVAFRKLDKWCPKGEFSFCSTGQQICKFRGVPSRITCANSKRHFVVKPLVKLPKLALYFPAQFKIQVKKLRKQLLFFLLVGGVSWIHALIWRGF